MDETVAIFVLLLIALVSTATIILAWIKHRRPLAAPDNNEAVREIGALRRENERLNDRLAVLERIATDPADRTARAIEELR